MSEAGIVEQPTDVRKPAATGPVRQITGLVDGVVHTSTDADGKVVFHRPC